MSSQIPNRFGYKNSEMTAIESATNFLRSKERKPSLRSSNQTRKKITPTSKNQILGSTRF
jgi:hypothetical protein